MQSAMAPSRPPPDIGPESALRNRAGGPVAGVDEAGRGPWAGPVVAAAVILDPDAVPAGLADSKTLSRRRREAILKALEKVAPIGIGTADVAEIARHNILGASDLAMLRALDALPRPARAALIDGNRLPRGLTIPGAALVGGDGRSLSVAAASIVAKVTRDRIMTELAAAHPGYGWERNMGYGTPEHRAALHRLGITAHHRRGFRPIYNILCGEARETP